MYKRQTFLFSFSFITAIAFAGIGGNSASYASGDFFAPMLLLCAVGLLANAAVLPLTTIAVPAIIVAVIAASYFHPVSYTHLDVYKRQHYESDPFERYKRLKRVGQLTRRQLSAAREVACWREVTAQERDMPVSYTHLSGDEDLGTGVHLRHRRSARP